MKKTITVIGSSNTDLVFQTKKFPLPGETVMGGEFNTFAGGKGANQAVAASRLGGNVHLIARIGNDNFGNAAIKGFVKENIITDCIFRDPDFPSGVATIIIDENGQNSIVVAPGANNQLSVADIDSSKEAIKKASIILIQLEIPMPTVKYALDKASELGKKIILNPAPAMELEEALYPKIYVITPNETEASLLTGIQVKDVRSAAESADVFIRKGVENVLITLGEKGVYFKNKEQEFHVPAKKVNVKDTTAAGDIFNGAIAVALAENKSWHEAVLFGNCAASIGVSRLGAQDSVPYRNEINF